MKSSTRQLPRGYWVVAAVVLAVLVAVTAGAVDLPLDPQVSSMFAVSIVTGLVVLALWWRARAGKSWGAFDPWQPLCFPTIFVAGSFVAPAISVFVFDHRVGGAMSYGLPMHPATPVCVSAGVIAFGVGAAHPMARRAAPSLPTDLRHTLVSRTSQWSGRLLAVASLVIGAVLLAFGGMAVRGQNQIMWTPGDVPTTLLGFVPLASVTLLLVGAVTSGQKRLLSWPDMFLVFAVGLVIVASGSRSPLIELILVIFMFWTWRRGRAAIPRIAALGVAAVAVMTLMVRVRIAARGGQDSRGLLDLVLGDLAPVVFTTGVVTDRVPTDHGFEWGSTVLATLLRLPPSAISVPLFGQSEAQTGGVVFRGMTGIDNPDYGTAFSLPAEGYLNFGAAGLVLLMFLVGLAVATAYRWVSLEGNVRGLVYPVVVASLPFALRNDLHGAVKSMLYPCALMLLAVACAHLVTRRAVRRDSVRSTASGEPG